MLPFKTLGLVTSDSTRPTGR